MPFKGIRSVVAGLTGVRGCVPLRDVSDLKYRHETEVRELRQAYQTLLGMKKISDDALAKKTRNLEHTLNVNAMLSEEIEFLRELKLRQAENLSTQLGEATKKLDDITDCIQGLVEGQWPDSGSWVPDTSAADTVMDRELGG